MLQSPPGARRDDDPGPLHSRFFTIAIAFLVSLPALAADPTVVRLEIAATPMKVQATGTVTDDSHPNRPGDFLAVAVDVSLSFAPELGEAVLEVASGADDEREVERYLVRRGRVFQVDEQGTEVAAAALGDLAPATVAALHPMVVASALTERRDAAQVVAGSTLLFAWNDELWTVHLDPGTAGAIDRLERRVFDDILGDGVETIRYLRPPVASSQPAVASAGQALDTVVSCWGRELARLRFGAAQPAPAVALTAGDRSRDRARALGRAEMVFTEIAPHQFAADLASLASRVFVVEFADHLALLEGAFSSRVADLLATVVHERFAKPVRYFAFSHLHGQYVGGLRSWVHAGATVLVPPTTAPLPEQMVLARHDLHPDALAREPRPLTVETVAAHRRLADDSNVLDIYQVRSDHTDEYFIFYLPGQRVLLTGDLLFVRPDRALSGRSRTLCTTIADLGLEIDEALVTWPLTGYDIADRVSGRELRAKCAEVDPQHWPTAAASR